VYRSVNPPIKNGVNVHPEVPIAGHQELAWVTNHPCPPTHQVYQHIVRVQLANGLSMLRRTDWRAISAIGCCGEPHCLIQLDQVDQISNTDGFAVADNPCPSDECWNYDATTDECSLKSDVPQCATLQCGAKIMSVVFSKNLLGRGAGMASITPEPIAHGGHGYLLQCGLYQCDIKHFVEDNK